MDTTHSTAGMLDNVKAVENDFSVRKKFSGNIVVGAKHIHSNDFHSTSDYSIIFKKVISDDLWKTRKIMLKTEVIELTNDK